MFFPRQHLWVSLFPNWIHSVAGICVHACFNKPYAGLHNLHPSSSEQKLRKFRVRVCALTSVLTARTPGHAQRWIKYLTAWNLIFCVLLALIALLKKVHPYSPYPHTQPCLSVWATVCPGDSKTEWQVQAAPWHPQTLPPASTLHTAHCSTPHCSLLPAAITQQQCTLGVPNQQSLLSPGWSKWSWHLRIGTARPMLPPPPGKMK